MNHTEKELVAELLKALEDLIENTDKKKFNIRKDFGFFVADAQARAAIHKAKVELNKNEI